MAKKVFIEIKVRQEEKLMPYFNKLEIEFPLLFYSGRSLVMRDTDNAVNYI